MPCNFTSASCCSWPGSRARGGPRHRSAHQVQVYCILYHVQLLCHHSYIAFYSNPPFQSQRPWVDGDRWGDEQRLCLLIGRCSRVPCKFLCPMWKATLFRISTPVHRHILAHMQSYRMPDPLWYFFVEMYSHFVNSGTHLTVSEQQNGNVYFQDAM